jgi:hypothetical protein
MFPDGNQSDRSCRSNSGPSSRAFNVTPQSVQIRSDKPHPSCSLRESAARLAERTRSEAWTHEEYLAACLQRKVAARDAHGGEDSIGTARFPARKSLEEFDFDHGSGLKRDLIAHLATLDFAAGKENVIFSRPTRNPVALRISGCSCRRRHPDRSILHRRHRGRARPADQQRRGITQPPTDIGTAVVAVFDDTCGNLIQLIEEKPDENHDDAL